MPTKLSSVPSETIVRVPLANGATVPMVVMVSNRYGKGETLLFPLESLDATIRVERPGTYYKNSDIDKGFARIPSMLDPSVAQSLVPVPVKVVSELRFVEDEENRLPSNVTIETEVINRSVFAPSARECGIAGPYTCISWYYYGGSGSTTGDRRGVYYPYIDSDGGRNWALPYLSDIKPYLSVNDKWAQTPGWLRDPVVHLERSKDRYSSNLLWSQNIHGLSRYSSIRMNNQDYSEGSTPSDIYDQIRTYDWSYVNEVMATPIISISGNCMVDVTTGEFTSFQAVKSWRKVNGQWIRTD